MDDRGNLGWVVKVDKQPADAVRIYLVEWFTNTPNRATTYMSYDAVNSFRETYNRYRERFQREAFPD